MISLAVKLKHCSRGWCVVLSCGMAQAGHFTYMIMTMLYFHLPYFHVSNRALYFKQFLGTLHLHRRNLDTFYWSPLLTQEVASMTTSGATSNDKVGNMTILRLQGSYVDITGRKWLIRKGSILRPFQFTLSVIWINVSR